MLTYGQFLSRVMGNTHFLIVWDCDAKNNAEKLAAELSEVSKVTAFAFDHRENRIAPKGIENKYDETVLKPYSNRLVDDNGVELHRTLDNSRKEDFARDIYANGEPRHFVHFGDLRATVNRILQNADVAQFTCNSS